MLNYPSILKIDSDIFNKIELSNWNSEMEISEFFSLWLGEEVFYYKVLRE